MLQKKGVVTCKILYMNTQVDDKYQYSCDNKDNRVHGWISSKSNPQIGFWVITPSDEFRAGGPVKQDLTSHASSTSLAVSQSSSLLMLHTYFFLLIHQIDFPMTGIL